PLLDMMRGVVEEGTGRVVRRMGFQHPAGGKTGTTNDYKDAWFDGFTKDLSASVWVGYDSNISMVDRNGRGLTGGGASAPIWAYFMKKALSGKSLINFPVPEGILFVEVDSTTGYLSNTSTEKTMKVAVKNDVVLTLPPSTDSIQGYFPSEEPDPETNPVPNNMVEENVLPEF
ncbi:MAG: peptidase, partial [Nitrospinota bacterium]|nr:peptidase [Nitrospinota bacterium]